MSEIVSRFRITTSAFARPFDKEEEKIPPRFIYFISVEGDETEKDYFKWLKVYLLKKRGSLPFDLNVLTPAHSGYSSPQQVFELLEQCAGIRSKKMSINQLTKDFKRKYAKGLERYFGPVVKVSKSELKTFQNDLALLSIQYDIVNAYRTYGRSAGNQNPTDVFGMVIDRDRLSHTNKKSLIQIHNECQKNGFRFCISNPCFELWLYLHVCDVAKRKSASGRSMMLQNKKDKAGNTYMAGLVKQQYHHGKRITEDVFLRHYGSNVENAIDNARKLTITMPSLLNKLGTNVGELVADMLSR